jgi:hypothetical protein
MAGPAWAVLGCGIAAVFHFLVFRFFGLNRSFQRLFTALLSGKSHESAAHAAKVARYADQL